MPLQEPPQQQFEARPATTPSHEHGRQAPPAGYRGRGGQQPPMGRGAPIVQPPPGLAPRQEPQGEEL